MAGNSAGYQRQQFQIGADDADLSIHPRENLQTPFVGSLDFGNSTSYSKTQCDTSSLSREQTAKNVMESEVIACPEEDPLGLEHIVIKADPESYQQPEQAVKEIQGDGQLDDDGSRFSCSTCGKDFKSKSFYEKHVRSHLNEKPFACEICGTSFKYKWDLENKHMKVHSNVRAFSCDLCGKSYKHLRNLTEHMRSHKDDEPNQSDIIVDPKDFSELHMTTHPDKKLSPRDNRKDVFNRYVQTLKAKKHSVETTTKVVAPAAAIINHDQMAKDSVESQIIHFPREQSPKPEMVVIKEEPKIYPELEQPDEGIENSSAKSEEEEDPCTIGAQASVTGLQTITNQQQQQQSGNSTSPNRYFCTQCNQGWRHKSIYERHMTRHTGEKLFSCKVCGKKFGHRSTAEKHLRTHTGERSFPCKVCGKAFRYSSNLTTHMRIHADEKSFQCVVCGNGFNRKDTMLQHMRMHTGEKPFSCKICPNVYSTKWAMTQHMKTHAGEMPNVNVKTFTCDTCGSTFNRKDTLKQHVRSHTGEKPFACTVCVNVYRTKWALSLHMRTHENEEKNFSCEVCSEGFSRRSELAQHIRSRHARESRAEVAAADLSNLNHGSSTENSVGFTMTEFPRDASFRPELVVIKPDPDINQEPGQFEEEMEDSSSVSQSSESMGAAQPADPTSPFVCSICGRDLKYKCLYERHMLSHSTDKPFPCEVCGTKFKSKYDLKKHTKVHEDSKPITCQVCGKHFAYSWNFESHMRTHTGDKPFPCDLCGMRFNRKDILEKHMTLHTGEKPFPCKMCDSAFNTNWALVEHMRSHTGEEPYACEVCGRKFKRKGVYDRHLRTQHSKNSSDEVTPNVVPGAASFNHNKVVENSPGSMETDRPKDGPSKSEKVQKENAQSHRVAEKPVVGTENSSSKVPDAETPRTSEEQTPALARVSKTGDGQEKQQHKDGSQFVCAICNKSFAFKCLYDRHMPRHATEKTIPCEICGTKFKSKYDVKSHMRVHTERKTFSCEICGNRFNRRDSLKVHVRSHTEKKLFTCQVCGQGFGNINNFNNHMQTHSEERPFACDICGNRFIRKDVLDKHLRLHTGEKLFSCTVCDLGFNSRWQLSEHAKIHTVPVPFPCNVCGKKFKRKTVRNRHVRTRHGTNSTNEAAAKELQNNAVYNEETRGEDSNMSGMDSCSDEESESDLKNEPPSIEGEIDSDSQKMNCERRAPSPVEILGL